MGLMTVCLICVRTETLLNGPRSHQSSRIMWRRRRLRRGGSASKLGWSLGYISNWHIMNTNTVMVHHTYLRDSGNAVIFVTWSRRNAVKEGDIGYMDNSVIRVTSWIFGRNWKMAKLGILVILITVLGVRGWKERYLVIDITQNLHVAW